MFEVRRGATPPFLFSIHFHLSKRLRLDCGAVEPLPHMTTGTRRCRPPHDTRRRKAGNRRAIVILPVAASSYHKNRVLKRYSKKSSRIIYICCYTFYAAGLNINKVKWKNVHIAGWAQKSPGRGAVLGEEPPRRSGDLVWIWICIT